MCPDTQVRAVSKNNRHTCLSAPSHHPERGVPVLQSIAANPGLSYCFYFEPKINQSPVSQGDTPLSAHCISNSIYNQICLGFKMGGNSQWSPVMSRVVRVHTRIMEAIPILKWIHPQHMSEYIQQSINCLWTPACNYEILWLDIIIYYFHCKGRQLWE